MLFNMAIEVWKAVRGFEGAYEVSNSGVVRSLDRMVGGPRGQRVWRGREMKSRVARNGYALVQLKNNGAVRSAHVHTLVLEAFVSERPEGQECRHLDGDRLNNRLENLRWGTRSENVQDSISHGTHYQTSREKVCPRGHRVEGPNRANAGSDSLFLCRACQRATSWMKDHPDCDFDVEADKFYLEVMGGVKRSTRKDKCKRGHPMSGDNLRIRKRKWGDEHECVACTRIRAKNSL